MSAAIAVAPSPAPYDKPGCSDFPPPPSPSSRNRSANMATQAANTSRTDSHSPKGRSGPISSPPSLNRNGGAPPKILVKKEPRSPELPAPRHRPRRLDLSKGPKPSSNQPGTARPMTAREGLGIQEVGIACLSPGFVTHDPIMQEQVQRSMSVRDQQRHLIEQRLQQQSAKGDGPDMAGRDPVSQFAAKTPGMSRRNKAPPGLSIIAPSAQQFAHERVIQSAPLGQSFTGRHNPQPLTRHITNQPATLSNTSHIHHVPANQTKNRLPPISDVFGQDLSGHPDNAPVSIYLGGTPRGPLMSPGHPPPAMQHQQQHQHQQQVPPPPTRPREYQSAEEAQVELAGGRTELLPKIIHYGGPSQPPTPPSPLPGTRAADPSQPSSRRRTRAEYEEGASPPLGNGPAPTRRGPFGAGRDSPETQRAKRDEFLQLCGRAWDLFHS
ncbi:hypothetical protein SODALDRAFT_163817 [Sodiomyces alkalinus F11]|uniref:Uncharacterized protein n=1 Tax=Sodiomyces alkalinus (strain CBS 110278 / VKM F-3762 / F11) TaxID=1314773 RepID=A0A3N2PVK2_SODAK|nr:hypothetical protein SODALDRAFT_163817 [Sodiomyces alkalinus F11]ROT38508.1 hypothetical protein SODALDRAFT_163817 [Sodiomyces alkalinus F11]